MPSLSVVVCTRGRGRNVCVLDTVRSILASESTDLELLVVDQSDDASVKTALAVLDDARIRYIRTSTRGLSKARTVGLRTAQSPLVAMTDDDCIVDPEWSTAILEAFAVHPRIALVFGNVVPAPVDASKGFIPGYERPTPSMAVGISEKAAVEGMGACMAMRREVVLALGGFDAMLGAGGPFFAGEDVDMTLRVLDSGHAVYETPAVRVVHHGFRTWAESGTVARSYWFGAGAAIGKHVRRRGFRSLGLLARLAWRFVAGQSPVARSLGDHGMALVRLMAFLQGLSAGVSAPVDRATGHFSGALGHS